MNYDYNDPDLAHLLGTEHFEVVRRWNGSTSKFDANKALCYCEARRWDGSNHISLATGSQWEHERLYRTSGAKWILKHWSAQGETYEEITAAQAASWLVQNAYDIKELATQIAELEIA